MTQKITATMILASACLTGVALSSTLTAAGYLGKQLDRQPPFNQLTGLWAAAKLPGTWTAARSAAADEVFRLQQTYGGWSMSALGPWKRSDGSEQDRTSDGYATGFAALALQEAG